jgi:hypothetical protein
MHHRYEPSSPIEPTQYPEASGARTRSPRSASFCSSRNSNFRVRRTSYERTAPFSRFPLALGFRVHPTFTSGHSTGFVRPVNRSWRRGLDGRLRARPVNWRWRHRAGIPWIGRWRQCRFAYGWGGPRRTTPAWSPIKCRKRVPIGGRFGVYRELSVACPPQSRWPVETSPGSAHRNLTECSPLREDTGWSAGGCFHPPAR